MDKKDEIILQQLDVIRSMTENNINRMSNDFWGAPKAQQGAVPKKDQPPTADGTPGSGDTAKEEPAQPKEKIEDILAELDGYIGLEVVKEEVHNLINMVQVYKLRREHDLPTTDMSLHMVFTGNPGTGKTTVARIMARIYHSLDILSKGQLVEVDRSGLVAGYVGQTALKTQEVIKSALGGVLFIDEAYSLSSGGENDFGREAIETILKAMEDHRDDLIVIVAGYTGPMENFINSNPGLESRFNKYIFFPDYNGEQLTAMFRKRCEKNGYTLSEEADAAAVDFFTQLYEERSDNFGNGRDVRNAFEDMVVRQSNRVAAMENPSKEDLMAVLAADLEDAEEDEAEAETEAEPETAAEEQPEENS